MSSIATSSIVFACVFGGALLGMFLRKLLPQNHLSDDSKSVVMIAMGLVATMTALVLGLLISSAKNSFDTLNSEISERHPRSSCWTEHWRAMARRRRRHAICSAVRLRL